MSQRSKRELLEHLHPRYLKANKKEKSRIVDEFVAVTGHHRKYALRVLKRGPSRQRGKPKGRRRVYQGEVVSVLEQLWEMTNRICSRRLHPFLAELVEILERCGELTLKPEVKSQLLSMSRATIDRCLQPKRFEQPKGLSTTKPGSLLKQQIPIRTFADWDDARVGFLEVDLVAHCGPTTAGQYLNTLTCTDIATGWTECLPLLYRSQQQVFLAIQRLRETLPFDLLGLDSDNGGEFINDLLYRYCQSEQITFTRSRPYKKNDQAHVEQKNWAVVRQWIGYDRFETQTEYELLQAIYRDLRLYINFFQPVMKLVSKERVGQRVIRRHDQAQTPYRRIQQREDISVAARARLTYQYLQLNPVQLRRSIDANIAKLWRIAK